MPFIEIVPYEYNLGVRFGVMIRKIESLDQLRLNSGFDPHRESHSFGVVSHLENGYDLFARFRSGNV